MKGSTSSQLNAIIVINIIVILLGFFFGLIGHGTSDAAWLFLISGAIWVCFFAFWAYRTASNGGEKRAIKIAACTLPAAWLINQVASPIITVLTQNS